MGLRAVGVASLGVEVEPLRQTVYIEHTDRYGVVYNGNYLRFMSR
jgi:acyl-CoA thioesterase FadM